MAELSNYQVLIIEGSDSVINLYKKMLNTIENKVIEPKVISHYEELFEFINKRNVLLRETIHLIVSESKIDGKDIIDELEILKSYMPAASIYIVSNFISIEKLKKVLKFGVLDWLEKPITPNEFYKMVEDSIYKGQSYDSKMLGIENEIKKLELNDEVGYFSLKRRIVKLIMENPSRHESQYLLGVLYDKKGFTSLAEKHFNASEALK
jgi:DNA-binding NtrC family response regulator